MRISIIAGIGRLASRAGLPALALAAAIATVLGVGTPAFSQSPECDRLRQAIADSSHNTQGAQYQAAAERQRGEIDRTVNYMRSIGCENRKFLFFGSEPPAQCASLTAQVSRMRANLDDLQSRAGGGAGGRGELIARYNSQCASQPKSGNILDAIFGQPRDGSDVTVEPLNPDGALEKPVNPGEARAGSKAVCVRACDGSFFPVSYSAGGGRLDSLEDMCRALCPNADVSLFTYPASGEIEQAVSPTGQRYVDTPTALKYRQTYDASCSCKRRGQTWAETLANAEAKLGHEQKSDIIVTPEKSAELSRPKADPKATAAADGKPADPKAKLPKGAKPTPTPVATPTVNAGGTDINGVDTNLSQQAATISHDTTGIGANGEGVNKSTVGQNQGQALEETAPDGSKRRVRVVGPVL